MSLGQFNFLRKMTQTSQKMAKTVICRAGDAQKLVSLEDANQNPESHLKSQLKVNFLFIFILFKDDLGLHLEGVGHYPRDSYEL